MLSAIRTHPFVALLKPYFRWYFWGLVALVGVDAINVALPLVIRDGIDGAIAANRPAVWKAAAFYLGLMAVQSVGRYLWRIYLLGTSHLVAAGMRRDLYARLQRLSPRYHSGARPGDLMSRFTNDIESVRQALGPGVLVALDALVLFVLIVPVMASISWKLTLYAFVFFPLVPWLTARVGQRIDTIFERLQRRMSTLGAFTQEVLSGVRLIKALVQEPEAARRFRELSKDYEREGIGLARYEAIMSPSLGLFTNLGMVLILFAGGLDVLEGTITVGTFVAFQRFLVQLSWPMEAIGWAVTLYREGSAGLRRVREAEAAPPVESVRGPRSHLVGTAGHFDARRLRYGFARADGQAGFAIEIDSLAVPRGSKIGIVGPIGCGKTTLLSLFCRLEEPPTGCLYFDGCDVAGVPLVELRRRIGAVESNVILFGETVRTNVLLGTTPLSDEEIRKFAGGVCLEDELNAIPGGLDAVLGERGRSLSGGQRQRLGLLRALVRQPEALLLDDPFSAVDVDTEERIAGWVWRELASTTVLFATHRLGTMPLMDEIWLMDRGTVVGRGSHERLLREHALYRQLWERSERDSEAGRTGLELREIEPDARVGSGRLV